VNNRSPPGDTEKYVLIGLLRDKRWENLSRSKARILLITGILSEDIDHGFTFPFIQFHDTLSIP
jgi:hypothetical protein